MRFRVVHDGQLTHVFDAETGVELRNAVAIKFVHDVRPDSEERMVEVTFRDWAPIIEIANATGEAKLAEATELDSKCRAFRKIEPEASKVNFREFI